MIFSKEESRLIFKAIVIYLATRHYATLSTEDELLFSEVLRKLTEEFK